jgi:hypothetical protein
LVCQSGRKKGISYLSLTLTCLFLYFFAHFGRAEGKKAVKWLSSGVRQFVTVRPLVKQSLYVSEQPLAEAAWLWPVVAG